MFLFWYLTMLCLAPIARGQNNEIRTFFNPDTNPIIHIDFTKFDMKAVDDWRMRILMDSALTAAEKDKQNQSDSKSMATARDWISRFRSAGGGEVYLLVNADGLEKGNFGLVLTPLNGNSNMNGLESIFNSPGTGVGRAGNMLVYGPAGVIARMQPGAPNPRPDLADAIKSASAAPFSIALAPSQLQDAAIFGGKQGLFHDPAWIGVAWASLAVWPPPNVHGTLILQCRSNAAAQTISGVISKQIAGLANDPQTRQRLGGQADRLAGSLKPTVIDSRVTIEIDQKSLDGLLMPVVMRQVQNSMAQPPAPNGVQIAQPNREYQIEQIMIACGTYRKANQQQWPPDLNALVPKYLTAEQLKSEAHPDRNPGFVYRKPPSNLIAPDQFVFLYEAIKDGDTGDVYVGFAGDKPHFDLISMARLRVLLQN